MERRGGLVVIVVDTEEARHVGTQRLLDPAQLAHPLPHLSCHLGDLVRTEDEQRDHEDHHDLRNAEVSHRLPSPRLPALVAPVPARKRCYCRSRSTPVRTRPAARDISRRSEAISGVSSCLTRAIDRVVGVAWRMARRAATSTTSAPAVATPSGSSQIVTAPGYGTEARR